MKTGDHSGVVVFSWYVSAKPTGLIWRSYGTGMEKWMEDDNADVLYRYKYREMTDDNLKIITEGTLSFSRPSDFNDPFDCSPAYDRESMTDIFRRRPDLVKRVGDSKGLSPAKRIQQKGKWVANILRAVDSGAWTEQLGAQAGIFCLSRNPSSQLMWAHYAKNHTGFLVEFSISMDAPYLDLTEFMPLPVRYADERPKLEWGAVKPDFEDVFLTKSRDWEYEEEERTLDVRRGPGIHPYSRQLFLNSVTAGARMSDEMFEKLKLAVTKAEQDTGKEIPLYRAQLSGSTYEVYIPGHPDPKLNPPS
ncbi:hypothetical protein ASB58_00805 [Pseudomonas abyssi]|uniref:DUF2971 domain-containing protein n=2 Tax=Pseudomonas abyssi TaxID=170540 RepID=A0A395R768_9PSED|nr:hypothetical protein ASB58_00805 [Halopseudomonas gallaeciensis]